jgi:hypothetical protein
MPRLYPEHTFWEGKAGRWRPIERPWHCDHAAQQGHRHIVDCIDAAGYDKTARYGEPESGCVYVQLWRRRHRPNGRYPYGVMVWLDAGSDIYGNRSASPIIRRLLTSWRNSLHWSQQPRRYCISTDGARSSSLPLKSGQSYGIPKPWMVNANGAIWATGRYEPRSSAQPADASGENQYRVILPSGTGTPNAKANPRGNGQRAAARPPSAAVRLRLANTWRFQIR